MLPTLISFRLRALVACVDETYLLSGSEIRGADINLSPIPHFELLPPCENDTFSRQSKRMDGFERASQNTVKLVLFFRFFGQVCAARFIRSDVQAAGGVSAA